MAEIRTPEGVMIRVTSRPPEFFLRIVTPSGLEFGWPVTKGSIGYKVAEEIVALAEPAPKGSNAKAAGGGGDGVQLDPREIGWAPYVMIGGGFGLGALVLAIGMFLKHG